MTNRILKHMLTQRSGFLSLHRGAWIMDFQVQNGQPVIWTMENPSHEKQELGYELVWTGDSLSDEFLQDWDYAGTAQLEGLVEHLFIKG